MPDFPVIDAHLHLWDPQEMPINWLQENQFLNHAFLPKDYQNHTAQIDVEAMVFVECFVNKGDYLNEVKFVEKCIKTDPRIQAIVAQANVEEGADIRPFLAHLKSNHPKVVGIRRLIEGQPDPDFCIQPNFIRGVNALAEFNFSFDINIVHTQFEKVLEMVPQIEGVNMMLDHCGKPGIRSGEIERWTDHIYQLAEYKNVSCKLSDLPVEADWKNWQEDQIFPYIDVVVKAFGFDRLVYAADWPVCLQATNPGQWVSLLDTYFATEDPSNLKKFYNSNARNFYKL